MTLNEARHIRDAIASLAWCDEVLVIDSFSADDTPALAREGGATVIQNRFQNYAQQRNDALSYALAHVPEQRTPAWVFFLDADERSTPELATELRRTLQATQPTVWSVPRDNYLFGKLTRHAGWYPDYQARAFLLGASKFDPDREVHEVALMEGQPGLLVNTLIHYNYDTVQQFHAKQVKYSDYDAGILFKQGVRPKPQNFVLQPLREFWRRFVTLNGYKMGWHGLRLAILCAQYNLRMYRVLGGLWKKANGRN